MGPITTVIFDMYETLVQNPREGWRAGFEAIIREQNLGVGADLLFKEWSVGDSEFRKNRVLPGVAFRTYYQGWRDCFSGAFAALGLDGDPEASATSFIGYISRREPYPDTMDALKAVQEHWRTAVLSNADDDYLLPNLESLGVEFEHVLSSEKARVYKPLPGLFLAMLKNMTITPQETVYIGDRQFEDVQGASSVGINAVWINRTGDPPDPQLPAPAAQIRTLREIPELLHSWPPKEGLTR